MTTLTDFLLARIAEDEEAAKRMLPPSPWVYATHPSYEGDDWGMSEHHVRHINGGYECRVADTWHEHVARFIARNADPARVLAECEAKRRIVELHAISRRMLSMRGYEEPDYEEPEDSCHVCGWVPSDSSCDTLRFLALPYADHPDYREEWRP